MKHALCLLIFLFSLSVVAQKKEKKETFSCPPCGNECDKLSFEKIGKCPHCKMELVKHSEEVPQQKRTKAAILIFEGVQIIDFTGPYEVLGQAGYEVFTVAKTDSVLTTNMGMKVRPDFNFNNCPPADIFIIPGGAVQTIRENTEAVKWVKMNAERSEHVMSVCNGALILAETGLLNGLSATTFYGAIQELEKDYPNVKVISDQRFVDNGKYITTAGLSSGIDGALHIVEKLKGKPKAQMVALNIEYDWRPKDNYARASLADQYLNKLFEGDEYSSFTSARLLNTEGTREKWKTEVELVGEFANAEELEKMMELFVVDKVQWKKLGNPSKSKSNWSFTTSEGEKWKGLVDVKADSKSPKTFIVVVEIVKI